MLVDFSNLELKIGNENIERIGNSCTTKSFKFVGHHLDEYLSWDYHINHVYSKLASGNYAINISKNFLPQHIRVNLYNSLFRSHLEFGLLAWGGISNNKLNSIINLQKKCVRNVANKGRLSHTDPVFSKLNILKFNDLFNYNCTLFMHKFAFGKQPESFKDMFTPLGCNNRTGNYIISKYKTNFLDRFPSAFLPKVWNQNSSEIKNCISVLSLKRLLKERFISHYNTQEKCKYIECPDCHKT